MPSKPPSYLEDIALPGHPGRPKMALQDRSWLVHVRNRAAVAKLWARLQESPRTICGDYGFLVGDLLDDDGVPETLVSHWRSIDYADTGERIERIPGSMIARDLVRLGLGHADVMAGTVITPRPRPAGGKQAQSPRPTQPVLIRRRGMGVARGA